MEESKKEGATSPPVASVWRDFLLSGLRISDNAIYIGVGGLLVATAGSILVSSILTFLRALSQGELRLVAFQMLDNLLLILMLLEILHTVRVSIREHVLVCEPFLVVGLIAVVRRILIITAEQSRLLESSPGIFRMIMVEVGLLTLLILVLVFSIYLIRKAGESTEAKA